MEQFNMMNLLGNAFANGEIDALIPLLAEDCDYASQYANKTLKGANAILSGMRTVYANIHEADAYTFKTIEVESVLQNGVTLRDLDNREGEQPCRYGLLLYQYSTKRPVAVVVCTVNLDGKFGSIRLCRDKTKFKVSFYGEEIEHDSPEDLPSTVVPLTAHDRYVAEMRSSFAGQKWDKPVDTGNGIYIWRKADEYVKQWLPEKGYTVLESAVFDECIGYRCSRKGYSYTVFLYAYGKEKTVQLDGGYCSKLAKLPFAENSIILILYLNVNRYMDGEEVRYRVRDYSGSDQDEPEFWHLKEVDGAYLFEYYPRKEMMDQLWRFMYAFNREDTDIYDCIITDENPSIEGDPDCGGTFMNSAFYGMLREMHRKYGDMKMGYVRYNDVVYSSVPYLDGLGFFCWSSYVDSDRMHGMICYPFDGGERQVAEFIKTGLREPEDLFDFIPKLTNAVPLAPALTERFAVKLFFDNGECRKYVLPVAEEDSEQEVISFRGHVFSDGIWDSVSVLPRHASRYAGYPECGPAITFKNGFSLAGTRCYLESEPYSELEPVDEVIYSDETCQVRKIWQWNVKSLYEDGETGLLKVLIRGEAFNYYGESVFASVDGKRMTALTFDSIDNFREGLALVAVSGHGYGFVDKDMKFVVPMQYDEANSFMNGRAIARNGDRWFCIDKAGNAIELGGRFNPNRYQDVGDYSEGMCRVSTLKLSYLDLAYYSEYDRIAGIWGFVNEAGEEVISPQYIYANDFEDGIAIVAKGKWTIDPKWDNECNQGRYWTEEERWGGIDKNGNEVIPCVFDEIKFFCDCTEVYMAHSGGWENGHWGVIDKHGNWLADPIFEDIDYECRDGLFAFYAEDKENATDTDVPLGIYDLRRKEVIFEPQFLNVSFLDDGDIQVEVFDKELGRRVEKIIDRTGKERFKSVYSSIDTRKEPYEVVIEDKGEFKHGLIDKNGNVLLPCIHQTAFDDSLYAQKRILFKEKGKQGIKDYDGNIVIPAIYHEIRDLAKPFLAVRVGTAGNYKEGLITRNGKTVIPAKYKRIDWCRDRKHFFTCSDEGCEMYVIEEGSTETP